MVTVGCDRKSVRPSMSRWPDRRAERRGLGDRVVAVDVGQRVLADDDARVDAGRVDGAQHLDHAAQRRPRRGGPSRELDDHHVAGLGVAPLLRRHLHVGEDAAIERHDKAHRPVVDFVAADDRRIGPLENADDAALGAIAALMLDPGDDSIAVQRFLDVGGRDVEVAAVALGVGDDEAVAGLVHLEPAHDDVHAVGQAEAVAADLQEIAVGDQRLQQPPERRTFSARDAENLEELTAGRRVMDVLPDLPQHLLAREHARPLYRERLPTPPANAGGPSCRAARRRRWAWTGTRPSPAGRHASRSLPSRAPRATIGSRAPGLHRAARSRCERYGRYSAPSTRCVGRPASRGHASASAQLRGYRPAPPSAVAARSSSARASPAFPAEP